MNKGNGLVLGKKLLIAAICNVGVSPLVSAADGGDSFILEEVLVTAERRAKSLQDTALAISALNNRMLERRGADEPEDLQFAVPGLTMSKTSTSGVQVTLRGVGAEHLGVGGDPGVAINVDGVYLQSTNYITQDFFDIERVEVLRGPQGTLYGRNAIGGAINIISRAPSEEAEVVAKFTVGNFNRRHFQSAIGGPLVDNALLGRLSFSRETRDGFLENVSPVRVESDSDDSDYMTVRGQLMWLASDTVDVTLRGYVYRDDARGAAGIMNAPYPVQPLFQGFDLRTLPPSPVIGNPYVETGAGINPSLQDLRKYSANTETYSNVDAEGGSLEINWQLDGAKLTAISGYNLNTTEKNSDVDFSDTVSTSLSVGTEYETFSQEVRLASTDSEAVDWLAGIYYYEQTSDLLFNLTDTTNTATFGQDPVFIIDPGHVEVTSYAAFGQATWHLNEQLGVTVGLRYTKDKKQAEEGVFSPTGLLFNPFTGGPLLRSHDKSWNKVTSKLGVEYTLNNDVLIYGGVSSGYKSGGINTGSLGPEYDPETVIAYESGIKSQMYDGRLQLNAAAFYYDYTDLQVSQIEQFTPVVNNAGEASSHGIELEVMMLPIERLRVDAVVSWLDATYEKYDTADSVFPLLGVQDLSGNQLNRSPEWSFNVGAEYSWSLGDAGELTARVDFAWKDDQYYRAYNLDRDRQEAYHRTDARLSWSNKNQAWSMDFWVKNIEDEEVVTNIVVSAASLGSTPSGNISPPRTFGLTVGYEM